MHQEVTAEFLKRLLKGELKLKDKALQLKAYETVMDNAESLHDLFASMVRLKILHIDNTLILVAESCTSTSEIPQETCHRTNHRVTNKSPIHTQRPQKIKSITRVA